MAAPNNEIFKPTPESRLVQGVISGASCLLFSYTLVKETQKWVSRTRKTPAEIQAPAGATKEKPKDWRGFALGATVSGVFLLVHTHILVDAVKGTGKWVPGTGYS